MELENELKVLKERLYELKERKATLKSELDVKKKYLDQTKQELQAKLDAHGISYKNLDATIIGLTRALEEKKNAINTQLEELLR